MISFKPPVPVLNRGHPQARNLLAAWPHFEGGGDSRTLDIGPRKFHGSFTGSPAWTVDQYGRELTYNGTNAWLDMGDVLDMGTDSFTCVLLINVTDTTSQSRPIQKRGTGSVGTVPGWYVAFLQSSNDITDKSVIDDGSNWAGNTTNVIGPIGEWFSFAFRVDRSGETLKQYNNGEEKTSVSLSSVTGSVNNSRKFTIGASDETENQFLNGKIADARIYQGALSVNMLQEISADHFSLYRQPQHYFGFASEAIILPPLGEVSVVGQIDILGDLSSPITKELNPSQGFDIRVELSGSITKDFRNVQTFRGAIGIVADLDGVVSAQFTREREGRIDVVAEFNSPVTFEKMKAGQIDAIVDLVASTTEGDTPVTDQDLGEAIVFRVPKIDYTFRARKHPTGRRL